MGFPPSIDALLAQWWGGSAVDAFFSFSPGQASNMVFGGNPPYQLSDFLAVYPKFGNFPQSIAQYTLGSQGSGYALSDTIAPVEADASGALIQVTAVDGSGHIIGSTLVRPGTGYSLTTAAVATTTSASGTGATVNITQIAPGTLVAPMIVMQMYINLALASLQKNKWLDYWQVAMSLFVAHFLTLYLLSDGNKLSTPGQIAQTGLARGIAVSKAAGDVNVSYETIVGDLEGFASWNRTEYGQQLATFATIIGMGPMYIYG